MSLSIIINLLGLLIIFGIVWWFWLNQPKAKDYTEQAVIDIKVDAGAYTPGKIKVKQQPVITLKFLRKDPSPCAAYVLFDQLKISQQLALNKETVLELRDVPKGEYVFTCEMNMYRGRLIIE